MVRGDGSSETGASGAAAGTRPMSARHPRRRRDPRLERPRGIRGGAATRLRNVHPGYAHFTKTLDLRNWTDQSKPPFHPPAFDAELLRTGLKCSFPDFHGHLTEIYRGPYGRTHHHGGISVCQWLRDHYDGPPCGPVYEAGDVCLAARRAGRKRRLAIFFSARALSPGVRPRNIHEAPAASPRPGLGISTRGGAATRPLGISTRGGAATRPLGMSTRGGAATRPRNGTRGIVGSPAARGIPGTRGARPAVSPEHAALVPQAGTRGPRSWPSTRRWWSKRRTRGLA